MKEEIAAMFSLSDLKQTKVYREIFEEVQAELQAQDISKGRSAASRCN
ncbi:MAG: hypothetical protein ACRC62_21270 [Microcoleus sp.]